MALAVAKLAVATHLLGLVQGYTRIVHQQYWSKDVPSQSSQPPKSELADFWGAIYVVQKPRVKGVCNWAILGIVSSMYAL